MQNLTKMVNSSFERYYRALFAGHTEAFPQFYQDYAKNMIKHLENAFKAFRSGHPMSYVISGPKGTGKTSALALICRQYLNAQAEIIIDLMAGCDTRITGEEIVYTDKRTGVRRILHPMAWVDTTYYTHAQLIQELRQNVAPNFAGPLVLFLDDFGRGYDDKAGWNLNLQEDFFDNRWKLRMPTYITTNIEPSELRKWEGWERITDRILDRSWTKAIGIIGDSRRK